MPKNKYAKKQHDSSWQSLRMEGERRRFENRSTSPRPKVYRNSDRYPPKLQLSRREKAQQYLAEGNYQKALQVIQVNGFGMFEPSQDPQTEAFAHLGIARTTQSQHLRIIHYKLALVLGTQVQMPRNFVEKCLLGQINEKLVLHPDNGTYKALQILAIGLKRRDADLQADGLIKLETSVRCIILRRHLLGLTYRLACLNGFTYQVSRTAERLDDLRAYEQTQPELKGILKDILLHLEKRLKAEEQAVATRVSVVSMFRPEGSSQSYEPQTPSISSSQSYESQTPLISSSQSYEPYTPSM